MQRLLLGAAGLLAACATGNGNGANAYADLTPANASFAVQNNLSVPVPEGTKEVRIWFPLPREEAGQQISDLQIEAPAGWQQTRDQHGNRYVYVDAKTPTGTVEVKTSFKVRRQLEHGNVDPGRTRPLTAAEKQQFAADLAPNKHIVIDDEIVQLAARIRGSDDNPVIVARKLYDWVLNNIDYWVKDPGNKKASPVGSADYCMTSRTGNCTDFHSLWTALARASGIPTRMNYGSLFKPSLDGKDADASYHCWPEFYAPNLGWIPNDVAVADIYRGPIALDANNTDKVVLTTAASYSGPSPRWVDFYFGNLDARRVTWTQGRDLTLSPPQAGGPVNAVPKGYVEIDGAENGKWTRKMTFRELH